jgi:dihydrofolate synthase/folylpolyglutamate synthase
MEIPRGLPVEELASALDSHRMEYKTFPSLPHAYQQALQQADPEDLIFVGGSTFTVAEIL